MLILGDDGCLPRYFPLYVGCCIFSVITVCQRISRNIRTCFCICFSYYCLSRDFLLCAVVFVQLLLSGHRFQRKNYELECVLPSALRTIYRVQLFRTVCNRGNWKRIHAFWLSHLWITITFICLCFIVFWDGFLG